MLLKVPAEDCHKYYYFFSGSGPAGAHQCQENNLEKCPGNTLSIGKNCADITSAEIQNNPANCSQYRLYSGNTEASCFAGNAFCSYADVNRDTVVNILDLTTVRNKLNTTCVNGVLTLKNINFANKISDVLAAVIMGFVW